MSTNPEPSQGDAVFERTFVAEVAGRIFSLEEAVLGATSVARGYFCETVGAVTEEQIQEYIEKHEYESPEIFLHRQVSLNSRRYIFMTHQSSFIKKYSLRT